MPIRYRYKEKKEVKTIRWHPYIAIIFSLFMPGLGQVYNGQFRKGIIIFTVYTLIAYIMVLSPLAKVFAGFVLILLWLIGWTVYASADALRTAILHKDEINDPFQTRMYYAVILVMNLFLAFIFQGLIKQNVINSYRIPSISMEPTLYAGDLLMADLNYYHNRAPGIGDVVIFYYPDLPEQDQIKRCAGLEGDTITVKNTRIVVPDGMIYVLGDNAKHSVDSRTRGLVPVKDIVARPLYVYWAADKKRIGKPIM